MSTDQRSWEERVAAILTVEVSHDGFEAVRAAVIRGVSLSLARSSAFCTILVGHTGAGKTTLCRSLVAHYGTGKSVRTGFISAQVGSFYVRVPSPTDVGSLVSAMLTALGDPRPEAGDIRKRTVRLLKLLETAGTKLIMLDEFQHLFEAGETNRKVRLAEIRNWLKIMMDNQATSVMIIGMPDCIPLITGDSQIARRFQRHLTLPYMALMDGDVAVFESFLMSFAAKVKDVCGISDFPDFSDMELVLRTYATTRGSPGIVESLFTLTLEEVLSSNPSAAVTVKDFARAAASSYFDAFRITSANAFNMDIVAVLTEVKSFIAKGP